MKFLKFLKVLGFITMLALVYIHMQMQIIDLAYEGKIKEKKIHHLIEDNGNIIYRILTLKSVNHIGVKILSKNSDMQFVDPDQIREISSGEQVNESLIAKHLDFNKKKTSLLSFFSLTSRAEAKPQE